MLELTFSEVEKRGGEGGGNTGGLDRKDVLWEILLKNSFFLRRKG